MVQSSPLLHSAGASIAKRTFSVAAWTTYNMEIDLAHPKLSRSEKKMEEIGVKCPNRLIVHLLPHHRQFCLRRRESKVVCSNKLRDR